MSVLEDLRNLNQSDKFKTYMTIGHEPTTKNLLWAFIDGNIEVNDGNLYHHINWDVLVLDNVFYGRIQDDGKIKILSIIVPPRCKYYPIPEGLINKLQEQFHPDEIKVFG